MRPNRATPELCPDQGSATIARRRLLTAAAAAPIIAALPVAAPALAESNADAPLFALSRRLAEVEATTKRLLCAQEKAEQRCWEKQNKNIESGMEENKLQDVLGNVEKNYQEYWNIVESIATYPATTTAGILEKLRIFQKTTGEWFGRDQALLPKGGKIFLSTLSDLERIAGG